MTNQKIIWLRGDIICAAIRSQQSKLTAEEMIELYRLKNIEQSIEDTVFVIRAPTP